MKEPKLHEGNLCWFLTPVAVRDTIVYTACMYLKSEPAEYTIDISNCQTASKPPSLQTFNYNHYFSFTAAIVDVFKEAEIDLSGREKQKACTL